YSRSSPAPPLWPPRAIRLSSSVDVCWLIGCVAAATASAASTMPAPIGVLAGGATENGLAVRRRIVRTCAGVSGGLPAATAALCISATMAVTCGLAIDVPMLPTRRSPAGLASGALVPALPSDHIHALSGELPLVALPPGAVTVTVAP